MQAILEACINMIAGMQPTHDPGLKLQVAAASRLLSEGQILQWERSLDALMEVETSPRGLMKMAAVD